MNKYTIAACVGIALLTVPFIFEMKEGEKESYRKMIGEHPFSQRERMTPEELKAIPKRDRPDLAWEQNYLATIDPALGRPAPERLVPVYQQVAARRNALLTTPGAASTPWTEKGPSSVGGRTRAIMYDPNDPSHQKVWAGGVTGGLWYNNNITDPGSQWIAVDDFWDNIAITSIAYDPTNTNVFYVGTGEGWGAGSGRGAGVWKTTDGGSTWNQLASTSTFYYVNDLAVRDESGTGVLYVAIRGNYYGSAYHGSSAQGLQRSVNGGSAFTQVMPIIPGETFNYAVADIEIAADGRLWVGTQDASYGGTDRGGGKVLYSDNGTSWTVSYTSSGGDRVEVACAPGNTNYVYAMVEGGSQVSEIVRTTNSGTSWSNLNEPNDADSGISSTDFSRGQAWYDLILAVHPADENMVFAGAIDLFRTSDGGTTWDQVSHWYGGFGFPEVHADQHQMVFNPGNSGEMLFGNDGGIYRTTNSTDATISFSQVNQSYNVTQFYACAIHPAAGSDYALAGSQDNGSHQFNNPGFSGTVEVTGGDGAYCFINQNNPNTQITSYVYNQFWRSTNGGSSFQNPRFLNDPNTGRFINPADYDDHQDALYSARTTTTVNRVLDVGTSPTIGNFTVTGMSDMASHLRVSPYTTSSTTLFVATGSGDLYKVTNANTTPVTTDIGSGLPAGYISCVEIGASENELIVTYTNYGLTSVWYTNNGGTTWTGKEGNLPDMPVRWALFNPNDRTEVILATEVGVWSTTDFNSASPNWTSSNSGLANVRVDMLQIRDSDDEVIAATHGRGLFTSNGFQVPSAPTSDFEANRTVVCVGEEVTFTNTALGVPSSYAWSITPSTFTYVNGTGATSPDPEVSFSANGTYTIELTVSNGVGTDTETKSQYISVGGLTLPFTEDFESGSDLWTIDNPDGNYTWELLAVGGNTPGSQAMGVNNLNYNAAGQRDGLISPPIDLSGYTSATLDFEYAYRRYDATYQDSLAVYISTDCGTTWSRLAGYRETGGGNFVTGSDLTSQFIPSSSSDWCSTSPTCPSISLDAYAGTSDLRIKIENICGYGNMMYVDNINITGVVGAAPVADFSAASTNACEGTSIVFTDNSTNTPTGWTWSVSPSTGVTFVNGTSASSQNPEISFANDGAYDVTLTASNGLGSDVETKTSYISIDPAVTPVVSVVSSHNNVCEGTSITVTASGTDAGASPVYIFKVNGSTVSSGSSNTYTTSALVNGDQLVVELTSSDPCASPSTVSSNTISYTLTPQVTPSVTVSASQNSICTGTSVTFTATPTHGGSLPTYQWKVNGANVGSGSATYSSSSLANGDLVEVVMTSNANCASATTATSNQISMVVSSPVTPTVSITESANNICSGTSVTFTATPSSGGSSPSYQWKVNGSNVAGTGNTYTSTTLTNGDAVSVVLTSSMACVTSPTVTSNSISMIVNNSVTPSVTVTASVNSICPGESVTFTANPTFGGSNPGYQWRRNGVNVGSNQATYTTSTLASGETVSVVMTSNSSCAGTPTATSSSVSITVNPVPNVNITTSVPIADLCKGDQLNLSASPTGGTWTGPGISGGVFDASAAGTGTHQLIYTYQNGAGCSDRDTITVPVVIVPKPTVSVSNNVLTCNENGYNYQWFNSNGPIAGQTGQTYGPSQNGSYYVRISSGDCFDNSDPVVISDIHVDNWILIKSFELYPNPAATRLTVDIQAGHNEPVTLTVSDMSGKVLMDARHQVVPGRSTVELDVRNLPSGVYALRGQSVSGSAVRTFEIVR